MKSADVVLAWQGAKGVPFVHQGRDKAVGLDCIGLAITGFNEAGWEPQRPDLISTVSYKRLPDSELLTEIIAFECDQIPLEELLPADLLIMKWEGMDELPRHVAGVTRCDAGGIWIVHTHWIMKKVCEHRLDALWKSRVVTAWRCKGMV